MMLTTLNQQTEQMDEKGEGGLSKARLPTVQGCPRFHAMDMESTPLSTPMLSKQRWAESDPSL